MFDRLAASLDIAFKWLDLDQTFSSNILFHEQTFDRLATSGNKASPSGKRQPVRDRICVTSLHNFSGNTQYKTLCGLTLFDVWSNIVCSFSHPMFFATNTMLDENIWSFSRGLIDHFTFLWKCNQAFVWKRGLGWPWNDRDETLLAW